jgi:hypothetical protein
MPPPRAWANEVFDSENPDALSLMCPAPISAFAKGRTFPTETETRGPNKKLWICVLALRPEHNPPTIPVHAGFGATAADP